MELTELRSKEEVKQDIEATRRSTEQALHDAKTALVTENPAVLAWKRTKLRAQETKFALSEKARSTDCKVRTNIYSLLGGAALLGIAAGFLLHRKRQAKARLEDYCG